MAAEGWEILASGSVALFGSWMLGRWFEVLWMPRRLGERARSASKAFAAVAAERAPEIREHQESSERILRELSRRMGWSPLREQRILCTLRLFWAGLALMDDEELLGWRRTVASATPREAWGPIAAAAWRVLEFCATYPSHRRILRSSADSWLFGAQAGGDAAAVRLTLDYTLLCMQLGPLDAYSALRRTQPVRDARMLRQLGRIVTDSALRGRHGSEGSGTPAAEPGLA